MHSSTEKEICPKCGNAAALLHPMEESMLKRLKEEAEVEMPYSSVCTTCYKLLSKQISHGTLLNAEKKIQKDFRKNIWKSRLHLVRQGRTLMAREQFAEAAACYEKYLKIIEYTYEIKRTEITAETFKDRPREITLIAVALWSLLEVYDAHITYQERQEAAAELLGNLIGYTNLYTSVVKAASLKLKTAKNPKAYKLFLKTANVKYSGCFIATVAYPYRNHPTLLTLCAFRDQVLLKSVLGRGFTSVYYRFSPSFAYRLQHISWVRRLLRRILPPIATCLKWLFSLNVQPYL